MRASLGEDVAGEEGVQGAVGGAKAKRAGRGEAFVDAVQQVGAVAVQGDRGGSADAIQAIGGLVAQGGQAGAVPLAGDVLDVFVRANLKNVALLKKAAARLQDDRVS